MRLIGYIRVSRVAGREGASFISPEDQRKKISAMATAHGHTVIDWEKDLGESGSRYERPGLQAALEAVEAGAANGIAVAKLDRFARSVKDAAKAVERLEAVGGCLIAVDLNMDTSTSAGRLMRNVLMALAEFELERNREESAANRSHAAERGVHVCKTAIVGYRKGADKRLELDSEAAPVIREVFLRRGAGASWSELCRFLDERLPRENGKWPKSTVTTLIQSRTYLGEARGGGVVNVDAHPPLVTRAQWEAAQVAEADGRRVRYGDGALLAGLLTCGSCGQKLTRISNGSRGYHNYKCRKRNSTGVCEAPASISVTRADEFVSAEFLAAIPALSAKGEPAERSLELATAALEAAELELSEYQSLNLVSVIGRDAFGEQVGKRVEQVEEAQRELRDASAASPLETFRDLRKQWPSLSVAERRQLLGSLLDHVEVAPAPGTGRGTPVSERLRPVWR